MYMMLYYHFNFLLIMISYKICRFFCFCGNLKKKYENHKLDSYFADVVESLLLFPIQVKKWINLVCVVKLRLIFHKIFVPEQNALRPKSSNVLSITLFKPKLEKVRYTFIKFICLGPQKV